MKKTEVAFGKFLFRIRGITPIPFYLISFFYSVIQLNFLLTGLLLIGIGEILRFFSVGYLGISSRKTENAEVDQLISNGPYRFVRNPIYLGNVLIYLGFAVLSNVFFPVFPAIIIVFFTFAYYFISLYEESVLRARLGAKYENYLITVPRFLPVVFSNTHRVAHGSFDPVKALKSEKVTLFVLVLALSAILIKNYTFS